MKKTLITILILGLLTQVSFAQELDKAKLDSYFKALEVNNKFMGSVALSKNGEIIYTKTIGYADVETGAKADINSKYRIGSISKTFTTALIFKGVEIDKINLNQTIDNYFPGIKNADKITIGNLLNHRSGIFNFTNDIKYITWNTLEKSEKEMIEIIEAGGSVFEPDSKAEYSNSNFVLLTFILEKTFKMSYADLLKQYITEPLGLENTYLGGKINPKNNECRSYRFFSNWSQEAETDISIPLGAGGVVSTPTDLVKFSNALFGGKIISEESLKQMKTVKDGYGMGLFQIPFYDRAGFGHSGGIDGFASMFAHFSDGNVSFAWVSNGINYKNNNISLAVLSAVFGRPYDIPDFKTYILSAEDLDQYLGVYSSTQIPLKITISKDSKRLMAQATGQPAFELDATEKDKFKFDQAGLVMEFNPSENTFILKQGGGQFTFTKE